MFAATKHVFSGAASSGPVVVVSATINVGTNPQSLARNPSGSRLYVGNAGSPGIVSVINTSTNDVTSISSTGRVDGLTVNPAGTRLYVASGGSNNIAIVDTSNNTIVGNRSINFTPKDVVVNPAGTRLYSCNGNDSVSVIDTSNDSIITSVSVGSNPNSIDINPSGTRVYVCNSFPASVSVIDTSSNSVIATVSGITNDAFNELAVSPDGSKVYVTREGASENGINVIDTATNTAATPISLPSGPSNGPFGVAVNPAGTLLYVSLYNGSKVGVINLATGVLTGTVTVGSDPRGVAVNPAGDRVYVANRSSNTVSVLTVT